MAFRNETGTSYSNVSTGSVRGGVDVYDGSSESMTAEAKAICPNLNNDERVGLEQLDSILSG